MKILIVNKFLYPNGGSETYIFEVGKQLQRMGHEVEYFGMEHEGRIVGNHAECYTSDMDFHGGGLSKLLYPFKIIYSREARKKIRGVLDDFKPDVVHLNNFNFQITPSILDEITKYEHQNKVKVKVLYTAHDYQWVCPNHMMKIPSSGKLCFACSGGKFGQCTRNKCIHNSTVKSLLGSIEGYFHKMRHSYRKIDYIICPSDFLKKQLDTNPLFAVKTITMHNFVEPWHGTFRENNDKKYVLYFGRYAKEKGVETLLEVCKEFQDIPFIFAGGGPLEEEVNKLENVENVGFTSGDALINLIHNAQFTVFPSEWYENCPYSVIESQMYGTPVLASNIGGVPELLQENVTGELFAAGNKAELAEKIKNLWYNTEQCSQYSQNCKKVEFDTSDGYCKKLVKLYED